MLRTAIAFASMIAAARALPAEQPLVDADCDAASAAALRSYDARAVGDAKAGAREDLAQKMADFRRARDADNEK